MRIINSSKYGGCFNIEPTTAQVGDDLPYLPYIAHIVIGFTVAESEWKI